MNRPASMREFAGNIFASKAPAMIILRLILALSIIMMGAVRLRVVIRHAIDSDPYNKDIFHEYLMAKAVLNGDNPYLPLDELARMYVGELPYYPHPSPHPPIVSILALPLAFFDQDFDILWLILELLFIAMTSILLTRWAREKYDLFWIVFLNFLMLAWLPVQFDLDYGQLSIPLLLFLTGAWLSIRRGSSIVGGILLGLSIAIKLITFPILLYFVLKRDWRTVISGAITFLGLNLLSVAVIGFRLVLQFYTQVSPGTFPYYRGYAFNYSSWSIGWRLFYGTGSPLSDVHTSPPLIYSPDLAAVVSFILPLIILAAGLIWACKIKDLDIAFSLIVCISVIVSPISWLHYHTLLVIPIAVALRWVVKRDYPSPSTIFLIVLLLLFFFVNEHIPRIMTTLSGGREAVDVNKSEIPFAVSLLNWIPILEVVSLSGLLLHLHFLDSNKIFVKRTDLVDPGVRSS